MLSYQRPFKSTVSIATSMLAILLLAPMARADVGVTIDNVEAGSGTEIDVPINVSGAGGLEGLQFVLKFDPAALELVDVTGGAVAEAANIDLKQREPGTVRVAMVLAQALQPAEGQLLLAKFNVLAEAGHSASIGIEEARASAFNKIVKMPMWLQVTTTPGGVRVTAAESWLLVALAAMVILTLLVIVIVLSLRLRAREPMAAPRMTHEIHEHEPHLPSDDKLHVKCPKCGRDLLAPPEAAGHRARCTKCGCRMMIPPMAQVPEELPIAETSVK